MTWPICIADWNMFITYEYFCEDDDMETLFQDGISLLFMHAKNNHIQW